jgi:hypothetical protein
MADQRLPKQPQDVADDLMNPRKKADPGTGIEQQAAEPAPPDIIIEN